MLVHFTLGLFQNIVNLLLDSLVDLALVLFNLGQGRVAHPIAQSATGMQRLTRILSCHKEGTAILLLPKHVVLKLKVLKHICLLKVALVEIKELAADSVDVLRSVVTLLLEILNFLVEALFPLAQKLLHFLELFDLLVEFDDLLTALPLLLLCSNLLFQILNFLLG